LAQPTARDAVRAVAENHGACLRPIQLRRTNTGTGEVDQVLIPCGATLSDICPPCAKRAKELRAAQCREGWHLDTEPITEPPPPDEVQAMWVEHRAQAQADRDRAAQAGEDTTELDELIGELDQEIKRSGLRGEANPGRPRPRRQRSTRRRQDAPELPRRKISPHTIGKTYTAPDGKTFRPSMFITLTCPSYGRVTEDGTPADPGSYDYQRAARDAQAQVRDVRVHDARHTAATLLIAQGVHIRVVQEVLGHTRVTTTERYTHVATLQMKDASERMGQALWGEG
jgi:hypothetical protein